MTTSQLSLRGLITYSCFCCWQGAQALSYDALQGLTYLQVKGSGLANTCSVIEGGSSNLKDIKPGDYRIQKFCMEPTSFTVKEESQLKGGKPEFVKTKLTTRLTYTLDEVRMVAWRLASSQASWFSTLQLRDSMECSSEANLVVLILCASHIFYSMCHAGRHMFFHTCSQL